LCAGNGSKRGGGGAAAAAAARLSGYDFEAWEKFDVEKALREVDEEAEKDLGTRPDALKGE